MARRLWDKGIDDRGQLLTLDLLLSLVPLVIVIGVSANMMTGTANQMQEYIYSYDMQREVNDAIDVIVKSPGTPLNWSQSNPPETAGLAIFNLSTGRVVPNYLDSDKVVTMNNSYLSQLLSTTKLGTSYWNLNITSAGNTSDGLYINFTNGSKAGSNDIFKAERIALLKFEELIAQFTDIEKIDTNYQSCGSQGVNSIYMHEFNVTALEFSSYDYWLVAESNDTSGGAQKGSPSSSFWGFDGYPFKQTANSTDCDDYGPITSPANTDDDGSIFKCGVMNPPYVPGSGQDEICDQEVTQPGFILYKFRLDSLASFAYGAGSNGGNRLLFQIPSNSGDGFNVYLIRTQPGVEDQAIHPLNTDFKPVIVSLEVGR